MSVSSEPLPGEVPRIFLDAELHPHRSLPPRGFALVMGLLGGVSVSVSLGFWLIGAWPVCGFFGLDVLLLYLAFRLSYRSARLCEHVRLTERELTVERVPVRGTARRWRFEPAWLRIVFEEKDEYTNRLTLASHGRSLVLGSFLPPSECRRFAATLQGALTSWRAALRT